MGGDTEPACRGGTTAAENKSEKRRRVTVVSPSGEGAEGMAGGVEGLSPVDGNV